MLITFRSSASNDVLMFEHAARDFLRCIGKKPDARTGIITPPQLSAAIDSLRAAIDADKVEPPAPVENATEDDADVGNEHVRFSQRAQPMLELLERALAEEAPVIWQQ